MKYLSSVISFIFLISFQYHAVCSADVGEIVEEAITKQDWTLFEKLVDAGEMKGFFTKLQATIMIQRILSNGKRIYFTNETIGQTHEKNNMIVYCVTHEDNKNRDSIPIVLLTGAHHAREPLSISMVIFTLLRIIIENNKGNIDYVDLLRNSRICALPIVNIDGYLYIEENFKQTGQFLEIRKNRRNTGCTPHDIGVDLNRNYEYKWGIDNKGSSSGECNEDYRGPAPFSEPETKAIKDFVERNLMNLQLVINFHAYGNLWIYPYNCCPEVKRSERIAAIYQEFSTQNLFPPSAKIGNAQDTINYLANGEATDWLLGAHGILGLSPELGLNTEETNSFFPAKETIYNSLRVINVTDMNTLKNNITIKLNNHGYSRNELVQLRIDLHIDYLSDIHSKPDYPRVSLLQNDELTSQIFTSFDLKIPEQDTKNKTSIFSLHTYFTINSWSFITIKIELSDIPHSSIFPVISIGKGDKIYFSINTEQLKNDDIVKLDTFVKLLIIVFAIILVIISGLGLASLIKQHSVKRWSKSNRVYEFKDLSANDSTPEDGGIDV